MYQQRMEHDVLEPTNTKGTKNQLINSQMTTTTIQQINHNNYHRTNQNLNHKSRNYHLNTTSISNRNNRNITTTSDPSTSSTTSSSSSSSTSLNNHKKNILYMNNLYNASSSSCSKEYSLKLQGAPLSLSPVIMTASQQSKSHTQQPESTSQSIDNFNVAPIRTGEMNNNVLVMNSLGSNQTPKQHNNGTIATSSSNETYSLDFLRYVGVQITAGCSTLSPQLQLKSQSQPMCTSFEVTKRPITSDVGEKAMMKKISPQTSHHKTGEKGQTDNKCSTNDKMTSVGYMRSSNNYYQESKTSSQNICYQAGNNQQQPHQSMSQQHQNHQQSSRYPHAYHHHHHHNNYHHHYNNNYHMHNRNYHQGKNNPSRNWNGGNNTTNNIGNNDDFGSGNTLGQWIASSINRNPNTSHHNANKNLNSKNLDNNSSTNNNNNKMPDHTKQVSNIQGSNYSKNGMKNINNNNNRHTLPRSSNTNHSHQNSSNNNRQYQNHTNNGSRMLNSRSPTPSIKSDNPNDSHTMKDENENAICLVKTQTPPISYINITGGYNQNGQNFNIPQSTVINGYDSDSSHSSYHIDGYFIPNPNVNGGEPGVTSTNFLPPQSQYLDLGNFNDYYGFYGSYQNLSNWSSLAIGGPFHPGFFYKSNYSSSSSENGMSSYTDDNLTEIGYNNQKKKSNSSGDGCGDKKKSYNVHDNSNCDSKSGSQSNLDATTSSDGSIKHRENSDKKIENMFSENKYTPPDRFLAKSYLVETRDTPATLIVGSKFDDISQSMWDRFLTAQQTEQIFRKKMYLWRYLFLSIKRTFPRRYGLYLVGSTITGFGTNSSDVDMCLVSRYITSNEPRIDAVFNLTELKNFLMNTTNNFEHFHLIQAKVPILRFRDVHHSLEVDLNFNNCVGIRNTHLLYCYQQLDWRLKPLAVIVKLWAQFHHINDAKCSTISSYSLVLMVIHYLQCGVNPPILPCLHLLYPEKFQKINELCSIDMIEPMAPYANDNNQTLGELFLNFLKYYSYFDYSQYAISVRTAGVLPIEECRLARSFKNDPHQWKQLCIEEPFDLTNTARSVYDGEIFERIKQVFLASWNAMHDKMDLDSVFTTIFLPSKSSPTDETLL